MRRMAAILFMTLMTLVFTGVTGRVLAQQPPPEPPPVPAPAQEAQQKGDKLEIVKEIYYYESEALGRRDPFLSIITLRQKEEEEDIVAPPLEKYDLSQMRLFAVVLTQKQQFAMLLLPDGKYYTVMKGDKIGIHDGFVTSMSLSTVSIIEKIKDYKGRIIEKEVLLRLREEEGE